MPPCCSAGGIFSVALSVTQPHRIELCSTPHHLACNSASRQSLRGRLLALPGALPSCPEAAVKQLRGCSSPALASLRRRCPDFPPARPAAAGLKPGLYSWSQRSPGPPATSIIAPILRPASVLTDSPGGSVRSGGSLDPSAGGSPGLLVRGSEPPCRRWKPPSFSRGSGPSGPRKRSARRMASALVRILHIIPFLYIIP